MASFRNADMSPDPNVKQGSRIVHPMYSRYVGKDGKCPGDEMSKTAGSSSKNITPTNFPINVRLCNRLRNIVPSHSMPPNSEIYGNYGQINRKDITYECWESNSDQEDFHDHVNYQPVPSLKSSEHIPIVAKGEW